MSLFSDTIDQAKTMGYAVKNLREDNYAMLKFGCLQVEVTPENFYSRLTIDNIKSIKNTFPGFATIVFGPSLEKNIKALKYLMDSTNRITEIIQDIAMRDEENKSLNAKLGILGLIDHSDPNPAKNLLFGPGPSTTILSDDSDNNTNYLDVGGRVAYILRDKCQLGVIKDIDSNNATVILDNKTAITIPLSYLRLVDYWKDSIRLLPTKSLKFIDGMSVKDIYKRKKPVTFGFATLRGMWLWGNRHVFNRQLKMPVFVISKGKKGYGSYRKEHGKPSQMMLSTLNHNFLELFSTVLHEMIHQHNYEADNTFERKYGAHGVNFTKWIPIIKEQAGVAILIKGKVTDDVTDFTEVELDQEAKIKKFYFCIYRYAANWFGAALADEYELSKYAGHILGLLRAKGELLPKVYAGTCTNARAFRSLNKTKKGERSPKEQPLLPGIIDLLKQTSNSLEDYYSVNEV